MRSQLSSTPQLQSNRPHQLVRLDGLVAALADDASMFASVLPTLPSMPNVERLVASLPPCENMSIGSIRDVCAVCEHCMLE